MCGSRFIKDCWARGSEVDMSVSFDLWIVLTGVASFINFFIIHVPVLRFTPAEKALKGLVNCVWIAFAGHMAFIFLCLQDHAPMLAGLGILGVTIWAALSLMIFFLLVFFYVLCVFGPTETSVRFRLIEVLASAKDKGANLNEILNAYNAKKIFELRLERLQEAGDIRFDNGKYFLVKKSNVFLILDALAARLKRWIEA